MARARSKRYERNRRYREKHWQKVKLKATWQGMIDRCYHPERGSKRGWRPTTYIEAGIKVCKRWRASFQAFAEDMVEPPTKSHTLDRINARRNYSPKNCRWATPLEQANNRTDTHFVEAPHPQTKEVIRLSLAEWGRLTGLDPSTIRKRIKRGWTFSRAVARLDEGVPF